MQTTEPKEEDYYLSSESDNESIAAEAESDDELVAEDLDQEMDDDIVVGGANLEEPEPDEDDDIADSVNLSDYIVRTFYVKPDQNITCDVMTKYEVTEAISIRTANIADGDAPFVPCDDLHDPVAMATRELTMRKFPYLITRQVGENINHEAKEIVRYYELWNPNEMSLNL